MCHGISWALESGRLSGQSGRRVQPSGKLPVVCLTLSGRRPKPCGYRRPLFLRCFDGVLDGCVFFEFDIVKLAIDPFDPADVDILYDVPCVGVD
jgi:hypothetical protein